MSQYHLRYSGILFFLMALMITGCGDHQTFRSRTAMLAITVHWPVRSRMIPDAAQSLQVRVTTAADLTTTKVADRPETSGAELATTVQFWALHEGMATVSITAYAGYGATGSVLASGDTTLRLAPGQTSRLVLKLASSIEYLRITPSPITLLSGEMQQLTVTAFDNSNAELLLTPDKVEWSSNDPGVATVDATGLVTAVADGETSIQVKDTESGKTASVVLTVTAANAINATDGAEMVWVPGGTFIMGNPDGVGDAQEWPAHQVTLTSFWMYKYEVTVAQYRAFCAATGHAMPEWPGEQYSWTGKTGWDDPALQQHPIVTNSLTDAKAYAEWAGVTLPTEAQWEYAARGSADNNYPWGGTATVDDIYNGWDQAKCANWANSNYVGISTWPVGSFPVGVSWCGAHDMAGNVLEFCGDWYGPYSATPATDPTGPATGSVGILRGGSWNDYSFASNIYRGAYRYAYGEGDPWYYNIGFRCVSHAPGP